MSWSRLVEPELLDSLPADDSRAVQSRQDLRRVNRLMFNALHCRRWMQSLNSANPPRCIVEIGSGDGTFMLSIARKLALKWPNVHVLLLDRQGIVDDLTHKAFAELGWTAEPVTDDIFAWAATTTTRADIVTANLFLHHFTATQLQMLFASLANITSTLIAIEPRRLRTAWYGARLLGLLGCNEVTRHDAAISVRAGFTGTELGSLWPSTGWHIEEQLLLPFSHGFKAQKRLS